MRNAPAKINGRRRPKRLRLLSEIFPITGSESVSINRGMAAAHPMRTELIPKPIL
jgi:hypothetical protein